MAQQMVEVSAGHEMLAGSGATPRPHDRGLLLIGIFKLLKSLFFIGIGIGAVKLIHKDLGDEAMKLATALRFDPEGKFVGGVLAKVDLISVSRLHWIEFGTFAYATLAMVEGCGLLLEKVWAEFLTLGLTISFLPYELFELVRDFNLVRVVVLLANIVVLVYLLWLLNRKKVVVR